MNKAKQIYSTHRQIILYAVCGVATTIANILTYILSTALFGKDWYLFNNALAWFAGVFVAFLTNKTFVFCSKCWRGKVFVKELFEFIVARLLSFGIEEGGMFLFVTILGFGNYSAELLGMTIGGDFWVKLGVSVVVVIINYFLSKYIIFKKNNE